MLNDQRALPSLGKGRLRSIFPFPRVGRRLRSVCLALDHAFQIATWSFSVPPNQPPNFLATILVTCVECVLTRTITWKERLRLSKQSYETHLERPCNHNRHSLHFGRLVGAAQRQ